MKALHNIAASRLSSETRSPIRKPHVWRRGASLALLAAGFCLSGCGTLIRDALVHSYMGVSFDAPGTPTEIADLARRSLAGDKQAQLDLGIAFEEGQGVEQDLGKARTLYKLAASDSGGPVAVYVPGVGGAPGRVMQVSGSPRTSGLTAAKVRLEMLEREY